jgi:hypothetical protein
MVPVGGGGHKEREKEGKYGGSTVYSCKKNGKMMSAVTVLRKEMGDKRERWRR